jgi:hypothetical protein
MLRTVFFMLEYQMVNGYLILNTVFLYPKSKEDCEVLVKQGFIAYKGHYYKCLLLSESNYVYSDPKDYMEFFKLKYNQVLVNGSGDINFIKIDKNGVIHRLNFKDKDDYNYINNMVSLVYNPVNQQYQLGRQASLLINSDLIKESESERYTIEIIKNNGMFEYDIQGEVHDYYSETVLKSPLSAINDSYMVNVSKILIDLQNYKDELDKGLNSLIRKLFNKLGTNPAVQGAPILLPPDIAELETDYNNLQTKINFNTIYNDFKINEELIRGNNNVKQ